MSKVPSWTYQFRDMTLPGTSYLSSLHGKSLSTVPGTQYILNKTQTSFSLRYESYHDTKASVFLFPLFQSTNLSRFSTPPPKHNFYLMNIYENFLWKGDMNAEGMKKWKWKSLSHVRLFATPRKVDHQAPLSMDFSRPEHQSGLPHSPGGLPNPGIKPRFQNRTAGRFLQILLHCRQIPTEPPEKPANGKKNKCVSFSNCLVQSLLAPLCDFSLNSQSL